MATTYPTTISKIISAICSQCAELSAQNHAIWFRLRFVIQIANLRKKKTITMTKIPSRKACGTYGHGPLKICLGKEKTMTMTKIPSKKTCYTYGHDPLINLSQFGRLISFNYFGYVLDTLEEQASRCATSMTPRRLVAPYRAILIARYSLREMSTPPKMVRYTLLVCDTPFCNISRDNCAIPIRKKKKHKREFCYTIATGIALYKKFRSGKADPVPFKGFFVFNTALFAYKNGRFASSFHLLGIGCL